MKKSPPSKTAMLASLALLCPFLAPDIQARLARIGYQPKTFVTGSRAEVLSGTHDPARYNCAYILEYPEGVKSTESHMQTGHIDSQTKVVLRRGNNGKAPWSEHLRISLNVEALKGDWERLSEKNSGVLNQLQSVCDIRLIDDNRGELEIILGDTWFNRNLEKLLGQKTTLAAIQEAAKTEEGA